MPNQTQPKTKAKSKKIVLYERNENNELVGRVVEKTKKRKVTALKKAILEKRERQKQNKEK